MTYSAHVKVEKIEKSEGLVPEDDGKIVVTAVAQSDRITSNTEGKINRIRMTFELDATETTLQKGHELYVSGHFG